jgi:methylenetetrahydrofolate dehydrogenase (NADP+) / methenyltetrahydrofolate cyclohydrolase
MTARLIDGKAVAAEVEREIAERVTSLPFRPGLVAVRVGEDPASEVYVRNKARKAVELGIEGRQEHHPADISPNDLLEIVQRLNGDESVDGILVQLPLPRHIDPEPVIAAIDPAKDVDGFHPVNVGRLHLGQPALVPCTPAGVIRLLERTDVPIRGSRVVVVGRSNIVGKPVAALLMQRDATVTVCHSRTRDLEAVVREADIVIAAIGRPLMITAGMIRPGAVVIDVGVNRLTPTDPAAAHLADPDKRRALEGKGAVLVGDVDFYAVREKASWITPVPGGVGPMTIAMLMRNTVEAAVLRRA